LGLVYQSMGDLEEANQKYLKSVRLASNDPDTLNDYAGFLCFERGDVDKALDYFDKAIRIPLNENRSMLYSNAARCVMTSDPDRAEDYLRAALSYDSKNPQLMVQIADLAYRQQQYLQARVFLDRAYQLAEPSPTMLFLLARTEAQLGDIAKSGEYREQLLELYPRSQEALAIDNSDIN
ncbi:MAG: tetratricopeptide repeat protein, partial [Gammaproteobacteria bacterium]|nr:tetratricopeptide repeat protein [Gammaproteobacteria bacterium]